MLPAGQIAHSQSHRLTDMIEWQNILTALKQTIAGLQKHYLLNVFHVLFYVFQQEAVLKIFFQMISFSVLFFNFCIRLFLIWLHSVISKKFKGILEASCNT